MSRHRSPWDDGRRAWERLVGWQRDALPGYGGAALHALSDIGSLRRLLDQAELAAVRAARQAGKSWAEIATMLGITRQSAWERWRDLDDGQEEPAATSAPAPEAPEDVSAVPDFASYAEEMVANKRRRRSWIVVPNVIGMSVDAAREALRTKGLSATNGDPDGPPLDVLTWHGSFVNSQAPESGAKVPPGFAVRLWIGRRGGGSAGVREPRRPAPSPLSAREMRPGPAEREAEEAIG